MKDEEVDFWGDTNNINADAAAPVAPPEEHKVAQQEDFWNTSGRVAENDDYDED